MIAPAAKRQWSTGKPAQHYRDGRMAAGVEYRLPGAWLVLIRPPSIT